MYFHPLISISGFDEFDEDDGEDDDDYGAYGDYGGYGDYFRRKREFHENFIKSHENYTQKVTLCSFKAIVQKTL